MLKNRSAVLLAAFAVSVLLLPCLAAAETFELPGQSNILVFTMYYYGYNGCQWSPGGPEPSWGEVCKGVEYYGVVPHIFYRVLVDENDKETILDSYKTPGRRTYSRMNDIEGHDYWWFDLPPLNVTIDTPGTYRVELRRIDINRPTDNYNPDANLGSIIDLWDVSAYSYWEGHACTKQFYSSCYYEYLKNSSVPIETLAQTLEVTEIDVVGPPVPPYSASTGPASYSAVSSDSPFSGNIGTHEAKPDVPDNPLVPMLFAGALITSTVVLASGSRMRTWLTKEGQAAAAARGQAYAQMERDKEAEAAWWQGVLAQRAKEKKMAQLKAALASYSPKALAGPANKTEKKTDTLGWAIGEVWNTLPVLNELKPEEQDANDRENNRIFSEKYDTGFGSDLVSARQGLGMVVDIVDSPSTLVAANKAGTQVIGLKSASNFLDKFGDFLHIGKLTARGIKVGDDLAQLVYGTIMGATNNDTNAVDTGKFIKLTSRDILDIGEMTVEAGLWTEGTAALATTALEVGVEGVMVAEGVATSLTVAIMPTNIYIPGIGNINLTTTLTANANGCSACNM